MSPNFFVVGVFGDLKNYKFFTKSVWLHESTNHIRRQKANLLKSLIDDDTFKKLAQAVSTHLLRKETQTEPHEFVLQPENDSFTVV